MRGPDRPLFASCQNIAELLLKAVPMRELRTLFGVWCRGGLGHVSGMATDQYRAERRHADPYFRTSARNRARLMLA